MRREKNYLGSNHIEKIISIRPNIYSLWKFKSNCASVISGCVNGMERNNPKTKITIVVETIDFIGM